MPVPHIYGRMTRGRDVWVESCTACCIGLHESAHLAIPLAPPFTPTKSQLAFYPSVRLYFHTLLRPSIYPYSHPGHRLSWMAPPPLLILLERARNPANSVAKLLALTALARRDCSGCVCRANWAAALAGPPLGSTCCNVCRHLFPRSWAHSCERARTHKTSTACALRWLLSTQKKHLDYPIKHPYTHELYGWLVSRTVG